METFYNGSKPEALVKRMECPIFVAEDILEKQGTVLPEGKTVDLWNAEQVLKREGITLTEGKTMQFISNPDEYYTFDQYGCLEKSIRIYSN